MRYLNAMFLSMFVSVMAFAQEVLPAPTQSWDEIMQDIANLITNGKAMGVLAAISLVILIIIKILKTDLVGGFFEKLNAGWKRAIVVLLGVISGILISITSGVVWWQAIVTGLFTSGGAMAIYEVFKPLFPAKKKI